MDKQVEAQKKEGLEVTPLERILECRCGRYMNVMGGVGWAGFTLIEILQATGWSASSCPACKETTP